MMRRHGQSGPEQTTEPQTTDVGALLAQGRIRDYLGSSRSLIKMSESLNTGPSMSENSPAITVSESEHDRMLELTTRIVAAQLSHTALPMSELPALIG